MSEKVIVIGGKGSAVVVAEQIYDASKKVNNIEFLGFAFDDENFGMEINNFPVLCKTTQVYKKYQKYEDIKFIFQLYRPDLMNERVRLLTSYNIPDRRFATFIHPSVVVSRSAFVGFGSVILANCVVNANVRVGNHCTIHSSTLIGHDTEMQNYNFIASNVAIGSNNRIGSKNFFGLNATFNNYLEIGDNTFVGMASNVVKDLSNNMRVYGNPAREFFKEIKPL